VSCKRPAQESGTHRSIPFEITEIEGTATWHYFFSIGNRNFSGKVQAVLGLLAVRRVRIKINRALKRDATIEGRAEKVVSPKTSRTPCARFPAKPAGSSIKSGSRPELRKAECTVVFICEACDAVYKVAQVLAVAKGSFSCILCFWPIHKWDGAYDYRSWRRIDRKK